MNVPFVMIQDNVPNSFATIFGHLESQNINQTSWGDGRLSPIVTFKIVHNGHSIILQYDVCEYETRAEYSDHNSPISRDSCVEFFIEFEGDKGYYNLEFNCLGTCLAAFGPDRNNRKLIPIELIEQIQVQTIITRSKKESTATINWQLTLVIPLNIFRARGKYKLGGQKARCNFYKCGDKLQVPHFLSWKPIETKEPDFHRPEFFGELVFNETEA